MKKVIILLSVMFLFSCTQEEVITEFQEQVKLSEVNLPQTSQSPTFKLYKESYLNQRSGFPFWYYAGNGRGSNLNEENLNFDGGQAYHDVNGDGFLDILVGHFNITTTKSTLTWYLNDKTNSNFIKSSQYFNSSPLGIQGHKIVKTDVNNDNLADFVIFGVNELVNPYTGNFTVLIQTKDNKFDIIKMKDGYYHNGAVGDLDGDGFVDVITDEYIWHGDGSGKFTKSSTSLKDLGVDQIIEYEILDINKDGFNDVILGTTSIKNPTTIILNDNGKFSSKNKKIELDLIPNTFTYDIEIYDIDKDGDLDIIELRLTEPQDYSELYVHINNNQVFNFVPNYIKNSQDGNFTNSSIDKYGWRRFKFDDLDGDGLDEIVIENLHDGYNPNNNNLVYNCLKKVNGVWKKYMIKFGN